MRTSWFISSTSASRPWSARESLAGTEPRSVTMAARAAPSSKTYATGSKASCASATGVTVSGPTCTGTPARTTQPSSSGGGSRSAPSVPRVAWTRTRSLRPRIPAACEWSACSWVRKTSVRSRTSRPFSRQRRAVSRKGSPASTRMRAAPASTHRELPPLPLARTHRRTERMYQHRLLARNPPGVCFRGGRALCYEPRHAAHEKVDQEPQQGEEAGAQAKAPAPQQGPAPRDAREVVGVLANGHSQSVARPQRDARLQLDAMARHELRPHPLRQRGQHQLRFH